MKDSLIYLYFLIILFSFVKSQNNEIKIFNQSVYNLELQIPQGTSNEIILNNIKDKFSYIQYEIVPNYGKINVSIYQDENFIDIIKGYKSYFYVYTKEEFKAAIKNKEKILIKCEEGLKSDETFICVMKLNIYTNKNKIIMNDKNLTNIPLFKYISKYNFHNYSFKSNNDIYLSVDLFAGKISINPKIKPFNEYENKKIYKFPGCKEVNLIIKGLENSFYSIYIYNINENSKANPFIVGSNYLFDSSFIKVPIFKLLDYFYYYGQKEVFYYLGINPINCEMNVEMQDYWSPKQKENLIQKNGFYQQIISSNLDYNYNINYKNNNYCLFSTFVYQMDNITGISLYNGISQSFLFNKSFNNFTFSFPHTQKENDININFGLLDKNSEFNIKIFLNDEYLNEFENITPININETITLKSEDVMKNCNNSVYICKILLFIESVNKIDSVLNINLNIIETMNFKSIGENTVEKSAFILSILFICGIGLFIMIILVLNRVRKILNQKEDLFDESNNFMVNEMEQIDEDNKSHLFID